MSMQALQKRDPNQTRKRRKRTRSFTLRQATTPSESGTHARYPLRVTTDGRIDREAWAQVVKSLRLSEAKGKTAPLARKIGVDPRTVDRWLRREVDVKEESVRAVARALDRSPVDLLVQVGFYQADEIAPPTAPNPYEDPVIKRIMADPRWTDDQRAELVQVQLATIEADLQRRQAEYDRLIRLRPTREAS